MQIETDAEIVNLEYFSWIVFLNEGDVLCGRLTMLYRCLLISKLTTNYLTVVCC